MAKLVVSLDGVVIKEVQLTKDKTTLGRRPYNDIVIDNLAISGEHAVLQMIGGDVFIEDLNSTNGTYVNGQPIKKHVLRPNDVIELGKYRLKFIADAPPSGRAGGEFVATEAFGPVAAPGEPSVAQAGLPETGSPRDSAVHTQAIDPVVRESASHAPARAESDAIGVIQVLSGANAGRELVLTKSLTTLGRPGVQVAVITRRPHGYFITHVEGASFPQVNGRALDAQARRLNDHDIIEIAGVKMEFFIRP